MPEYMYSPCSTVGVLIGEEYPAADYADVVAIRRSKCRNIVSSAEILARLPLGLVDRPGKYLSEYLRLLRYRVSPAGPITIQVSGADTIEAWSKNQTEVV